MSLWELPSHTVSAAGLVLDSQDNVLLILCPRRGWIFPSGLVERGETIPQALIREIQEETGIIIVPEHVVGVYCNTHTRPGYHGAKERPPTVNFDFICRYHSGSLTTSEESQEVQWFSRKEALEKMTFEKYLHRFHKMMAYEAPLP